ncbi:MAG TPA: hypothetical protein VIC25_00015, partial [Caulobacteraceae bacterium]
MVVTGGNGAYFPMIEELCASIRCFRSAEQVGLAVIDGGLDAAQKERLHRRYGVRIADFDWGFPLAERRAQGHLALKVQLARSFLDRLFPDADLIAWVDADAWVQDIAGLDLMFHAARSGSS